MKITISKDIYHSLLIEENDLISLCNFILTKYENLDIVANCIDGTKLETNKIGNVTSFQNPKYRKIKSIAFQAENNFEERLAINIEAPLEYSFSFPTVSANADFEIHSESDERALYISQEVVKQFMEMKPWYDLLARISFIYISTSITILIAVWFSFMQLFGRVEISFRQTSFTETATRFIVSLVICVITIFPLVRIQEKLFPKVFFMIGKQKKAMEVIVQWRRFIFGGVIFTIIIGVIANIISNFLLK